MSDNNENDRMPAEEIEQEQDENAQKSSSRLSQSEIEHRTFLMVSEKLMEYERKRLSYRKYGTIFIICSALVFLALIFSLEFKVLFLILWIVTILFCVALMLRADYMYDMYYRMLHFEESPPSEDEAETQETEKKEEE